MSVGFIRPPIFKFSFQVGDVWFCGFYPALPLNGDSDIRGMSEGVMSGHQPFVALHESSDQQRCRPLIERKITTNISSNWSNWWVQVFMETLYNYFIDLLKQYYNSLLCIMSVCLCVPHALVNHVSQTLCFTSVNKYVECNSEEF